LQSYFPDAIRQRFGADLAAHPLRGEIISTVTCNELLNLGGITFVFRAMEETGASALEVVHAASATIEVFGLLALWSSINDLDDSVPTSVQAALHLATRRLMDRATRWFLQTRGGSINVTEEVARFGPLVRRYAPLVPGFLRGGEAERLQRNTEWLTDLGAPQDLAHQAAALLDVFSLLDIIEMCGLSQEDPATVIPLYFFISERYGVDRTLVRITGLPRGDRWSALARQALRSDLYAVIAALTERVMRSTDPSASPQERTELWEQSNSAGLARTRATLDEIAEQEESDLATLSVALRVMRNLVAQGAAPVG
jgi:glutamate dehydrogenase